MSLLILAGSLTFGGKMPKPLVPSLYDQYGHDTDGALTPDDLVDEPKSSMMWPRIVAGAGDAGDMFSTQYALSKGGQEMNPLLPQNRGGNAAAQGLEALLTQYLLEHYGPDHPKLARIAAGVIGGVGAYSTIHNIRAGRQMR